MTIPAKDGSSRRQSTTLDILSEAQELAEYVSKAVDTPYAFGSFTGAVYNTAWVSMIRKPNTTPAQLRFPICFQYILDRQTPGGGWYQDGDFDIDTILNTLGGILAYKRNLDIQHASVSKVDLLARIESATQYLQSRLQQWVILESQRPAFQILIPAMLEYLDAECISFEFPGKADLMVLNREKLAKLPPKVFYAPIQTTVFFILECFVGKIDFSKCRGMMINGCMGSSPVATAAYLINSDWDEESEAYLENLVSSRNLAGGFQGIPDTYASTGFEVLWISAILLENGFTIDELPALKSVIDVTDEFYHCLGGLTGGFSPMGAADSDTTGKSLTVRNMLGRPTEAEALIKAFEGPEYFLTYPYELRPSFTPNCNILTGLLSTPDPSKYTAQIKKCLEYICSIRMGAETDAIDKWSVTELYPITVLSETLVHFFKHWEDPWMSSLPKDLTHYKAPLVLVQALQRVLDTQNPDGSWGPSPSPETTAYAIIALANFSSAPFVKRLSAPVAAAIEAGRSFLLRNRNHPVELLWSGKTTYTATKISKAYILAALRTKYPKHELSPSLAHICEGWEQKSIVYSKMLKAIPQTRSLHPWKINGLVLESGLFTSELRKTVPDVFGRRNLQGIHHDDRYFELVPTMMLLVNELSGLNLRADVMREIIALCIIHFEYDDFIEHVVATCTEVSYQDLTAMVDLLFDEIAIQKEDLINGRLVGNSQTGLLIATKLRDFVAYHLQHPAVLGARHGLRRKLAFELKEFIQHGLRQNYLNELIASASKSQHPISQVSFDSWLHTTSIINSGAFPFFTALEAFISQQHKPTASEDKINSITSYLAQEIARHIALKGRFTNDRVSLYRDRKDGNLNCVDFPEFGFSAEDIQDERKVKRVEDELRALEKHEVDVYETLFDRLEAISQESGSGQTVLKSLRFAALLEEAHGAFYELKSHK